MVPMTMHAKGINQNIKARALRAMVSKMADALNIVDLFSLMVFF